MVFKKSILISNDIWEKVKSNNNNFSSIKKKKKKSSAPPIKKPKLQEEQKQKLLTIPKHSIRYELNERAKERRKKSNIMKNAKILAKGIRADEEILKFFRPNEKPFIYKLLKFLRMNGDVITWDDDTLEVNINGRDYPGSSIVDILSYLADKNSNDLFYTTGDYDTTDRLMLGMPQNTIEVVKALNYLIPSGGYDDLFRKLGFDMKKARRLGEIKKKKQIANTKVFNTKAKQYNRNDLEAEEERAKRTMRRSLGIMGELEDQYDRDKKKSYSDSKYSTFIQREQNDPRVKMNKQQGDIFLQYQKGALSREEATDKILRHALKSRRRQLFKHDDDDDDVQGAEGGKESEDDEEFFDTSDVIFSPENREGALIKKNIQTDKVLDLIANTTPTIAQQAQTPTVAQQADMYNLRTTVERKPTQKFTPSTYNNQQKTKKKKKSGSEKRRRRKIRQTESEKEKEKI